jgi:hypothetical protein
MTGAAAMTAFTPPAEAQLHDYLSQVRHALYAHPDVSPDDVEADVREHVATEFAGLSRPVTLGELEAVLTRLGPPTQWAAAGANSQAPPRIEPFDWTDFVVRVRRRVLGVFATLWKGPEDWRLPYLTFALTLLAPVTAGLSLIAAFVFGRAAIELAKEKGQPLGARRWLVYPAILVIVFPLLAAILFTPAVLAGKVGADAIHEAHSWARLNWQTEKVTVEKETQPAKGERPAPPKYLRVYTPIPEDERANHERVLNVERLMPGNADVRRVLFVLFCGAGGLATWWTVLGLLAWAFPRVLVIFHPLLDGYGGRHGMIFAGWAAPALLVWLMLAYQLWQAAKGA